MHIFLSIPVILLCLISTSARAQEQLSQTSSAAADLLNVPLAVATVAPPRSWAYMIGPSTTRKPRLNPDAAALVGGIVGAGVGYGLMSFVCRNRYCEMGGLIGPLVGFVVGSGIGYVIAGGRLPPRYAAAANIVRRRDFPSNRR
jgi:hypothetical protein